MWHRVPAAENQKTLEKKSFRGLFITICRCMCTRPVGANLNCSVSALWAAAVSAGSIVSWFPFTRSSRSTSDIAYVIHISSHIAGFKRETSGIQPLLRQLFLLLPPWARIALAHKISLHIAGVETCPKFHTSSIAFMSGCYCNTSQVNKDPNKAAIAVARRRPHALRQFLSGTSQTRYSSVVMSTSIDT